MTITTGATTAELLLLSRAGDRSSFDMLYSRLYDELRDAARVQLRHYRGDTLDATALVHEAYLRVADEQNVPWQCRAHFLAVSARVMRRVVVDHIRERTALKRGGGRPYVTLMPDLVAGEQQPETLIGIDDALSALAAFNERLTRVAECRLFGGLTEEETAAALGVSVRTVQRDWQRARAWLQQALGD